jgi:flavin-dependent dehydrogenase
LTLCKRGRRVALIEKSDFTSPRVGESLSPGAREQLEYLGAWKRFEEAGHLPALANEAIWGGSERVVRDFVLTPFGHGWRLDRRRFDADLAADARDAGADLVLGATVVSFARQTDRQTNRWTAAIRVGDAMTEIEAKVLLDATGRASAIARRLGARRQAIDRLMAVFALVDAGTNVAASTLVEAFESGWIYSVPLGGPADNPRLWVAIMTDADFIRRLELRNPQVWFGHVERAAATRERLSRAARAPNAVAITAAHSSILSETSGEGWLAIGDAAASYDPLSSSGIVRALDAGIRAGIAAANGTVTGSGAGSDLRQTFGKYLAMHTAWYQMEQRWPDGAFWRRRAAITLDPSAKLVAVPVARDAGWPGDLGPVSAVALLELCERPSAASDVVLACRQRLLANDRKVVLGLQWLVQSGQLAIVRAAPVQAGDAKQPNQAGDAQQPDQASLSRAGRYRP